MLRPLLKLVLGILLVLAPLSRAGEVTTETLDEYLFVLQRQNVSLENFLNDPTRLNEYFQLLQKYYGADRFPRAAYDAVIDQARQMIPLAPGLSNRLWTVRNAPSPFQIQTESKTLGLRVNQTLWLPTLANLIDKLKEEATPIYAIADEKVREKRLHEILEAVSQPPVFTGTRAVRERAEADYYRNLLASPETKALTAYLLHRHLTNLNTNELLQAGDADLIFETFRELRQNPTRELERNGIPLPTALASLVRKLLPDPDKLKSESVESEPIFPPIMRQTRGGWVPLGSSDVRNYQVKPIRVPLNSIFKGIALRECVGGGDLKSLTPERWATGALEGVTVFNVESNGYLGFLQEATMVHKSGAKKLSVDFGVPDWRKEVRLPDGRREIVAERWLRARHAQGAKGFVLSGSNAINNAGVLPKVWESPAYAFGKSVGKAKEEFRHQDQAFASQLVKANPYVPEITSFKGDMVLDASVAHGTLTELDPAFSEADLLNPKRLITVVKNKKDLEQSERFLGALQSRSASMSVLPWAEDAEALRTLFDYMGNYQGSFQSRYFFMHIAEKAPEAILRVPKLLDKIIRLAQKQGAFLGFFKPSYFFSVISAGEILATLFEHLPADAGDKLFPAMIVAYARNGHSRDKFLNAINKVAERAPSRITPEWSQFLRTIALNPEADEYERTIAVNSLASIKARDPQTLAALQTIVTLPVKPNRYSPEKDDRGELRALAAGTLANAGSLTPEARKALWQAVENPLVYDHVRLKVRSHALYALVQNDPKDPRLADYINTQLPEMAFEKRLFAIELALAKLKIFPTDPFAVRFLVNLRNFLMHTHHDDKHYLFDTDRIHWRTRAVAALADASRQKTVSDLLESLRKLDPYLIEDVFRRAQEGPPCDQRLSNLGPLR